MALRRARRFAAALIAFATAAGLTASSASAGHVHNLGGIAYVTPGINFQGTGYHSQRAMCPGNMHVTSGGFAGFGGNQTTTIHHTYPIDGGDKGKKPDDGWKVTYDSTVNFGPQVYASCISQGVRYVSERFTVHEQTQRRREIECPGSRTVAASGLSGPRKLVMNSSTITVDYGLVYGDNTTNKLLRSKVYATCVNFDLELVEALTAVSPGEEDGAHAFCPAGKYVVGGGVYSAGGLGTTTSPATTFQEDNPQAQWLGYIDNRSAAPVNVYADVVCTPALN